MIHGLINISNSIIKSIINWEAAASPSLFSALELGAGTFLRDSTVGRGKNTQNEGTGTTGWLKLEKLKLEKTSKVIESNLGRGSPKRAGKGGATDPVLPL